MGSRPLRDYSGRRGMPRPPDAMRGIARDFPVPRDMRIPEAMRPYPKLGLSHWTGCISASEILRSL